MNVKVPYAGAIKADAGAGSGRAAWDVALTYIKPPLTELT